MQKCNEVKDIQIDKKSVIIRIQFSFIVPSSSTYGELLT